MTKGFVRMRRCRRTMLDTGRGVEETRVRRGGNPRKQWHETAGYSETVVTFIEVALITSGKGRPA